MGGLNVGAKVSWQRKSGKISKLKGGGIVGKQARPNKSWAKLEI